jgi:heme-degrading monooxygenase HmoA
MHARVSIFEAENPEQVDGMLRQVREQVLPQAKQMDGFKGLIALGDRQGGKTLRITLWESEEAMRASEEEANRMRSDTAEASGEQIGGVERYEVDLFEVEN